MNYPKILSEIIPEPPPQTYLRKSLFEISLSHISTKRFPPKILFEKYEEIVITYYGLQLGIIQVNLVSALTLHRNCIFAAAQHNPSKLGFYTRLARKLLKQEIY